MQKLTPLSILACAIFVELSAKFCHKIAWEMSFLLNLMKAMSVRACVSILATSIHLKVLAQFSLLLAFILLLELESFLSIGELLLSTSSCGLTELKSLSN